MKYQTPDLVQMTEVRKECRAIVCHECHKYDGEEIGQPSKGALSLGKMLTYIGVDYNPVQELKSKKLFEIS